MVAQKIEDFAARFADGHAAHAGFEVVPAVFAAQLLLPGRGGQGFLERAVLADAASGEKAAEQHLGPAADTALAQAIAQQQTAADQ